MDHTTAISKAFREDTSLLADMASLLGPSYRFPRAGIIRPGIMVTKRSCSEADVKNYSDLVDNGLSWEEIEKKIGKGKLIPRNVDYFTIHPGDCVNPDNVKKIHDLYADEDGRLRSFPVVFPVNEWWNIIPHSLRCFGASGLKYKSDFRFIKDAKGQVADAERVCKFPQNADPGKKVFGGRKWGERPCNPDVCLEYQKGECDFGGVIQFLVPGITGMGVWVLPTTSWYSLAGIKDSLILFSSVTGGRVSGTFGNSSGIFRVRKKKTRISRLDPKSGKSVRTEQWLITLDADIDLTQLIASHENGKAMEASNKAAALLSGVTVESRQQSQPVVEGAATSVIDTTAEIEEDKESSPGDIDEKSTEDVIKDDSAATDDSKPDNSFADSNTSAKEDTPETSGTEGEGKKDLILSAQTLWKTIAGITSDNSERKVLLKRVTGVDSFFDLDEERASKGLEKISEEMLGGY